MLESGFAPCTPAQRQGRLLTLVDELGLKKPLVSLVLSPGQYQVFQLDQPGVEPEELADAVRWKLKDLLDYRLDEAVVDTFPFPVAASRGRGQLLNAVSARKGMVQELIALVKGGQLQLLRIDIAELALRNLLLDRMPANRTNALVYLREQQGVLIIAHGGMLHMARRLDISLEQLRDASTQERAMQSLGLEIQRSMDYFESQLRQVPPRAVHVTGHPQALPLTDMLSGNLGVQVVEFDWQHLTGEVPPDLRSCLAIGAILPVPEMTA
ncbi:MAG: biogenesis protein MshI [Halomonadaceae bacterium]|nr:MAG: biogenesis protein MshI [Halomonadaceae bacterium]